MDVPRIVIGVVALGFSVIFHEIAHGWVALKLGDTTARDRGRLTFNPLPHISLFDTIVLPIVTLVTVGVPFGGAKPVPINPMNFRNPGFGMVLTSAAGPISNLLLAAVSFGLMFGLYKAAPATLYDGGARVLTYNGLFFAIMIFMNVLLASFNLIPIPPLDGSRVLRYFLPEPGQRVLDRVEPFGLFIIIALIWLGAISILLIPFYVGLSILIDAAFGRDFLSIMIHGLRGSRP